uniref:Uncharacterized protein n=1 Tax=Arundo donax TaxID=35708 RepID=A0A0A8ZCU5_ARUDO
MGTSSLQNWPRPACALSSLLMRRIACSCRARWRAPAGKVMFSRSRK